MMKINAEFNQRNESQLLVSCTYKIDGGWLFIMLIMALCWVLQQIEINPK